MPGGGPEIQSIAGAVAGEAVVAAGIQISREAPARRATREGARATEAVSGASDRPEVHQRENVEEGDLVAELGEIDPGHAFNRSAGRSIWSWLVRRFREGRSGGRGAR